jgi:uncharacterized protein (DUF3820 family)
MDLIQTILKRVRVEQFAKFKTTIQPKMTRRAFLIAFYDTFLVLPTTPMEWLLACDETTVFRVCISQLIDSTSLISAEAEFMKQMLTLAPKDYLTQFHATEDLASCQLGPLMQMILEYTEENIVIDS